MATINVPMTSNADFYTGSEDSWFMDMSGKIIQMHDEHCVSSRKRGWNSGFGMGINIGILIGGLVGFLTLYFAGGY